MPELPEVETIRRGLERYIVGKTIASIEIRLGKIFQGDPQQLLGAQIIAMRRYGKGLVIDLSNGMSITAHVKMTGQFVYVGPETRKNFHPKLDLPLELPTKHTHVIFQLRAGNGERSSLYFNDIRQFGWLKVIKTSELQEQPFFTSLGPEPLRNLTIQQFSHILASSSMPIKPFLMDQHKISGIGNIYANDSLYLARIDPRRPAKSLTSLEVDNLFAAVEEVLQKGIAYGGASETNYINVEGGKGEYQNHFLVYGQKGKRCPRDQGEIVRLVQAGRSTFYCPMCQT
ncbi:MAG TPA: bifunctional DNA-formamidopyrimidine glycosylase/DNA-(apurinic or apyrimidinic site) lyase [Patescibacteria group bacterium]|nr:bifunctional DNA-formamidopyrimidine glycosylase/DNA-(apurinic or apyrimidinic site) lyase [Patescibacteria group bacterium]